MCSLIALDGMGGIYVCIDRIRPRENYCTNPALTSLRLYKTKFDTTIMEWLASAFPAVLIGTVAFIVHWRQYKQQNKISSAQLALKLLGPWYDRENIGLINLTDALSKNKPLKENKGNIHAFLRMMEDIAIFRYDGTLTKNHVREFFGPNVKHCTHKDIQAVLNEMVKKDKAVRIVTWAPGRAPTLDRR